MTDADFENENPRNGQSTDDTERDAGGMVWQVDESDTTECIDCGGRAVQIAELDSDRYVCSDCGLVWNPHQVDTDTDRSGGGDRV